ncbi:MAG: hypothetical protein L0312_05345, partial [Acidobacteria bacterium]|nr:hypothetical protein [Acidobacteriota bacterium]
MPEERRPSLLPHRQARQLQSLQLISAGANAPEPPDVPSDEEVDNYDPLRDKSAPLTVGPVPSIRDQAQIDRTMRRGVRVLQHRERVREAYHNTVTQRNVQLKELGVGDITVRDVFNFLIGDDMKVVGAKWDQDGFNFSMENFKETWSEEPLWVNGLRTLGLGLSVLPLASAVNKSLKVGKLGKALGKGFDFVDFTTDQANPALKSGKWFEQFPTREEEIRWLKDPTGSGKKSFLNAALRDDEITEKGLKQARLYAYREQDVARRLQMRKALDAGEDGYFWGGQRVNVTVTDRIKDTFDRNFGNALWKIHNATLATPMKAFNESLKQFYDAENLGRFFRDVPEAFEKGEHHIDVIKSWIDPTQFPLDSTKHGKDVVDWSQGVYATMRQHQDDWKAIGAIEEVAPDVHVPMQFDFTPPVATKKGIRKYFAKEHPTTPKEASLEQHWPDFESMTLQKRQTELPEILQRLDDMAAGNNFGRSYIVDPREVTLRGLYVDRGLYHNVKFMKDFVRKGLDDGFTMLDDAAQTRIAAGGNMKGWVSLEGAPLGDNAKALIRRVLQKNHPELIKNGKMPYVQKAAMEQLFGGGGLFEQTQRAGSFIEAWTAAHKFMKTGLNFPTHLANGGGNLWFLAVQGINPVTPSNLKAGSGLAKGLFKMLKLRKGMEKLGQYSENMLDDAIRSKRVDLGNVEMVNSAGKKVTWNLNEWFADPMFKDLVERESFTDAEGLKQVIRHRDKMKDGTASKAMI